MNNCRPVKVIPSKTNLGAKFMRLLGLARRYIEIEPITVIKILISSITTLLSDFRSLKLIKTGQEINPKIVGIG